MNNKNLTLQEKLDILTQGKKSPWLEQAKWRVENHYWLKPAGRIAVKLNIYINDNNLEKENISSTLDIPINRLNLICKGQCDITISEIIKIEKLLNTKILNF